MHARQRGSMRSFPQNLRTILLLPVIAAGCYDADRHTERASFDEGVESVSVDVGSGDLTLYGSDVASVSVSARIEGDANHLGHSLSDGHLILFDECNDDHCSVDINATIPTGVPIELRTASGDIHIDGMLGTLSLHTGSGDIQGSGLSGADLVAFTGSGDVGLDVTALAERIHVRTGSGDVHLAVPSGRYALRIDTGSGDTSIRGITDDIGAPGTLEVTTGSGDVTIRGR
jgi:hypothetical protein